MKTTNKNEAAQQIAKSILDPVKFCSDVLGDTLWEKQAQILQELTKPSARVAVKSCHGSGKCIGLDEIVILADGSEVEARYLPQKGEFKILGFDFNERFTASTARATFENPQPMYRLRLFGGLQVVRSGGHRVLACRPEAKRVNGPYKKLRRVVPKVDWIPVDELEPGMFVATPESIQVTEPIKNISFDRRRLAFLAYLTTIGALYSREWLVPHKSRDELERWELIKPLGDMAWEYAEEQLASLDMRYRRPVSSDVPPGDSFIDLEREILADSGITRAKNSMTRVAVHEGMQPAYSTISESRRPFKQGYGRRYTLPAWVFSLPYEARRELVRYCAAFLWWHQGSGVSFRFRTYQASRIFRRLLQSIGIYSTIRHPLNGHLYRVSVTSEGSLMRLFALRPPGREKAIKRAIRYMKSNDSVERFYDRDFVHLNLPVGFRWTKVKSVQEAGIAPSVCIEVDNKEHAFITDIVEHNSFVSARAILWFITRYDDAIVISTAPQWEQVRSVVWAEIHAAIRKSKIQYPNVFQTSIRLGPKRYAFGLSTDEGVRFQGFRSGKVLIVMDEAPGIKSEIWDAINGIRAAGDVRVLAIGNPVLPSGRFFDIFQQKDTTWSRHTISAFDTPNLIGYSLQDILDMPFEKRIENPVPYLTSRQWVYEQYHEVGPQHPYWQSRVLGEFPTEGEYSLFSLQWLNAARSREPIDQGGPVFVGLDVGGRGENETAMIFREDDSILDIKTTASPEPMPYVMAVLDQWRERIKEINVDTAGIGFYFADQLQKAGYPVNFVNGGSSAFEKERYTNLRAELYSNLAKKFRENTIHGVNDPKLIDQLIGIQWKTGGQKMLFTIESKEEMRKRGAQSPDRADALSLAFASNLGMNEILLGRAW